MSTARTHELKTWPSYFQEVYIGRKNFEVRKNDRNFQPFDLLRLREYVPAEKDPEGLGFYTGRECDRMIGYMLYGGDPALVGMEAASSGIASGWVVLSLVSAPRPPAAERAAAWESARRPPAAEAQSDRSSPD